MATNLPTDVLRTFLAVIDLGSFTRAGQLLGRTQPAISLQIRRLEHLVGLTLLDTSGRNVKLTRDGEDLARQARQLLLMNDEIVARLQKKESTGSLRVGLPTDYATAFFQKSLGEFSKNQPDVQFSILCDVSQVLLPMFESDELDVVIAMFDGPSPPGLIYTWTERPLWTTAADSDAERRVPVPIVAHPQGCHYRARMISGLDKIGRAGASPSQRRASGGCSRRSSPVSASPR